MHPKPGLRTVSAEVEADKDAAGGNSEGEPGDPSVDAGLLPNRQELSRSFGSLEFLGPLQHGRIQLSDCLSLLASQI